MVEEKIADDYSLQCKGSESKRLGVYNLERVCLTNPSIPCSERYGWEYGFKKFNHRFYCSYRPKSDLKT